MISANSMSLLLVDDSRVARLSLLRQINSLPMEFDIIQAASADEAQTLMQDRQVDAALIDFNMPGRDGLVLAAEFSQSHPGMKMALVTANIQQPLIDRAEALGMTFLAKPTNLNALALFLGITL